MLSAIAGKSRPRPKSSQLRVSDDADPMQKALLAVASQDLIARLAQLRTDSLKTGQDGEIALIDHLAAVALNVARTSRLLLRSAASLLLCKRSGG
jgi:hypothetical protein